MHFLSSIVGLLVPLASAQGGGGGSGFASQGPGVSQMWGMICSTLPFCNVGEGAAALVGERGTAILAPLIIGGAVCAGVWAGIQLMRSQGSSDGIEKAKTTVLHAVLGTVLLLITVSIFRLVVQVVTWFS